MLLRFCLFFFWGGELASNVYGSIKLISFEPRCRVLSFPRGASFGRPPSTRRERTDGWGKRRRRRGEKVFTEETKTEVEPAEVRSVHRPHRCLGLCDDFMPEKGTNGHRRSRQSPEPVWGWGGRGQRKTGGDGGTAEVEEEEPLMAAFPLAAQHSGRFVV